MQGSGLRGLDFDDRPAPDEGSLPLGLGQGRPGPAIGRKVHLVTTVAGAGIQIQAIRHAVPAQVDQKTVAGALGSDPGLGHLGTAQIPESQQGVYQGDGSRQPGRAAVEAGLWVD